MPVQVQRVAVWLQRTRFRPEFKPTCCSTMRLQVCPSTLRWASLLAYTILSRIGLWFDVNLAGPVHPSCCLPGKTTARGWTHTPTPPVWTHTPTDDQSARMRMHLCPHTHVTRRCMRNVCEFAHARMHAYAGASGCFVNPEAFDCNCYAKKRRFCGYVLLLFILSVLAVRAHAHTEMSIPAEHTTYVSPTPRCACNHVPNACM